MFFLNAQSAALLRQCVSNASAQARALFVEQTLATFDASAQSRAASGSAAVAQADVWDVLMAALLECVRVQVLWPSASEDAAAVDAMSRRVTRRIAYVESALRAATAAPTGGGDEEALRHAVFYVSACLHACAALCGMTRSAPLVVDDHVTLVAKKCMLLVHVNRKQLRKRQKRSDSELVRALTSLRVADEHADDGAWLRHTQRVAAYAALLEARRTPASAASTSADADAAHLLQHSLTLDASDALTDAALAYAVGALGWLAGDAARVVAWCAACATATAAAGRPCAAPALRLLHAAALMRLNAPLQARAQLRALLCDTRHGGARYRRAATLNALGALVAVCGVRDDDASRCLREAASMVRVVTQSEAVGAPDEPSDALTPTARVDAGDQLDALAALLNLCLTLHRQQRRARLSNDVAVLARAHKLAAHAFLLFMKATTATADADAAPATRALMYGSGGSATNGAFRFAQNMAGLGVDDDATAQAADGGFEARVSLRTLQHLSPARAVLVAARAALESGAFDVTRVRYHRLLQALMHDVRGGASTTVSATCGAMHAINSDGLARVSIFRVVVEYAFALLATNAPAKALRMLELALRARPASVRALALYADALVGIGSARDALVYVGRARAIVDCMHATLRDEPHARRFEAQLDGALVVIDVKGGCSGDGDDDDDDNLALCTSERQRMAMRVELANNEALLLVCARRERDAIAALDGIVGECAALLRAEARHTASATAAVAAVDIDAHALHSAVVFNYTLLCVRAAPHDIELMRRGVRTWLAYHKQLGILTDSDAFDALRRRVGAQLAEARAASAASRPPQHVQGRVSELQRLSLYAEILNKI